MCLKMSSNKELKLKARVNDLRYYSGILKSKKNKS